MDANTRAGVSGSTDGPWSPFVHAPNERGIGTVRYPRLEARDKDCVKKLAKRTLTNLCNEHPAWLAHAHAKLDAAVVAALRMANELSDEEILARLIALKPGTCGARRASGAGRRSKAFLPQQDAGRVHLIPIIGTLLPAEPPPTFAQ